jgi:hypothetical protein
MTSTTSPQDEFQPDGIIDVRPFIDREDGGSLDQPTSLSMSMILVLLVVTLTLILMSRRIFSLLSILTKKLEQEEDANQVLISDLADECSIDLAQALQRLKILGIDVKYEIKSKKGFISLSDSRRFKNDLATDLNRKNQTQPRQQKDQEKKNLQRKEDFKRIFISDLVKEFSMDEQQILQRLRNLKIDVKHEIGSKRGFITVDEFGHFKDDITSAPNS